MLPFQAMLCCADSVPFGFFPSELGKSYGHHRKYRTDCFEDNGGDSHSPAGGVRPRGF